jgi:two-component system, chemotaxis family, response regulator PixG
MSNKYNSRLSNQLIFLKQKQFTGKVSVKDSSGIEWILYLCLGRLVWAEGGVHPHRAWKRLLDRYCPQVNEDSLQLDKSQEFECGDYYVLTVLLQKKFINREQATEFIKIRANEAMFDMLQSEAKKPLTITPETATTSSFLTSGLQMSISLVNVEDVIVEAEQAWVIWREKGLQRFSPNLAPQMKEQERLREEVSGIVFQNFLRLLDGQRSLRDLASRMNKDVRRLASSLMPYIQQELLEFVKIDDIKLSHIETNSSAAQKRLDQSNKPLIVCIDDSPQICNVMEQIITKAGYRFIGVKQALQAVPTIISAKPDLVFLDIGMPIVNGYEICSQIRRVSQIKHIPIVILTGNDGIVDRVRAKVVGANAFVSKPIEIEKIHQAIEENILSTSQAGESARNMVTNPA